MTLNPSADLKAMLPAVLGILKQAAQDPDSVDVDMGQAQQVKDALSNLINAKQQAGQGGQQKQQGKGQKAETGSSTENGDEDEDKEKDDKDPSKDDDDDKSESDQEQGSAQKKSQIVP